nr:RNA polymerase sigma factor [Sphingomonas sp. CDS-1]
MLPHRNRARASSSPVDATADADGFDQVYRIEAPRLRRFLKRRIWAEEDRNDIVQEAFLRLVASPSGAARANPGAYLHGIVRHLLADRVRAWARSERSSQMEIGGRMEPIAPDVAAEVSDMRERYRKAIDGLPPKTKEVYLLHRAEEFGYRQIADQLGISIRTVEWHVAQAIVRISKSIGFDA